jgi:hypothetical protein
VPRGQSARADGPAPARYGSRITFYGWSPTSDYVAYIRERHRPGHGRRANPIDEVQRMHRQVVDGAFAGFGTMVGGDVAGWAAGHRYLFDPAPRQRTSARQMVFRAGGREYTLDLAVGEKVGWVLRSGDVVVSKRTFDTIYLDFAAELFVAPDRRQAVLIMHLDAGWVVDAAVYPLKLRSPRPDVDRAAGAPDSVDPVK